MKKHIILAAAAAMMLMSAAADELVKIGSAQVADQATLTKAAAQLASLSGNPMLGALAASSIAKNPVYEYFGPMRAGEPMLAIVYADKDDLQKAADGAESDDFFDDLDVEIAVLYPAQRTKIAFMAAHPGSYEKDGLVVVEALNEDDEDIGDDGEKPEPERTYTAFSEDGLWATMSKDKDAARAALAEVAAATAPLEGDFVRFQIPQSFFKIAARALGELAKKEKDEQKSKNLAIAQKRFTMIESARVGVRATETAVDLRGSAKPLPSTEAAAVGLTPLGQDPLAFAPADAIAATAAAPGAGCPEFGLRRYVAVSILLEKYGIKSDYLTAAFTDATANILFDPAKAIAFFQGPGKEKAAAIDPAIFSAELREAVYEASDVALCATPASNISLAIAGHPAPVPPAEALVKTLPEAAAVRPYFVQHIAIYALLKGLAKEFAALAPAEAQTGIAAMLATLPPPGAAGTASAYFRNGDDISFITRISADEIRGVGALVNAAIGFITAQAVMK